MDTGLNFRYLDMALGRRLRARRKELYSSIQEFAKVTKIPIMMLRKYESGEERVPAVVLYLICKCLDTNLNSLFEDFIVAEDTFNNYKRTVKKKKVPLNILIVEDNSIDELLIKDGIEESKVECNVCTIQCGDEVIRRLKAKERRKNISFEKPDLVILDLNIPGRNGHEVLYEIKSKGGYETTPIIVVTNSVNYYDREKSFELNATGFITKSFDIKEFKGDIAKLISYWSSNQISFEQMTG